MRLLLERRNGLQWLFKSRDCVKRRCCATGNSGAVSWKGRKRFYEQATIVEHGMHSMGNEHQGYGVALDGMHLFTPSKNELVVPSRAFAGALAHEWNIQEKSIEPATMPLMTLTCSAIDVTKDKKDDIIEELMRYFTTDTLFYMQPDQPKLYKKQQVS